MWWARFDAWVRRLVAEEWKPGFFGTLAVSICLELALVVFFLSDMVWEAAALALTPAAPVAVLQTPPQALVVCLPGLLAPAATFYGFARRLRAACPRVKTVVLGGVRSNARHVDHNTLLAVKAAEDAVASGVPLVLVGHSLGAVQALDAETRLHGQGKPTSTMPPPVLLVAVCGAFGACVDFPGWAVDPSIGRLLRAGPGGRCSEAMAGLLGRARQTPRRHPRSLRVFAAARDDLFVRPLANALPRVSANDRRVVLPHGGHLGAFGLYARKHLVDTVAGWVDSQRKKIPNFKALKLCF